MNFATEQGATCSTRVQANLNRGNVIVFPSPEAELPADKRMEAVLDRYEAVLQAKVWGPNLDNEAGKRENHNSGAALTRSAELLLLLVGRLPPKFRPLSKEKWKIMRKGYEDAGEVLSYHVKKVVGDKLLFLEIFDVFIGIRIGNRVVKNVDGVWLADPVSYDVAADVSFFSYYAISLIIYFTPAG
jgi:hypothetical protein